MGLAFPYTALFLRARLQISPGSVGLIMGGCALAGLPLQVLGGHLSDRWGRRPILVVATLANMSLYIGLAFATHLWQAVALVFVERSLGWPLFLQSSNAMVADLIVERRRHEAFGIVRMAVMGGVVVGPAIAGLALSAGAAYPALFLVAGLGSGLFLPVILLGLRESRPAEELDPLVDRAQVGAQAVNASALPVAPGYLSVLRDRRFLAFCAVAVLPLYAFGQLYSTFPIVVTGTLGVSPGSWGLTLSLYALIVVCVQVPMLRGVRRFDRTAVMAMASAAIGLGLGAACIPGWPLYLMMATLAVGEALLSPTSSMIVSGFAPADLRGRYMGAWTLVWMFGLALGPTLGGVVLDAFGPRGAFALVMAAGLAGAALFPLLQPRTAPLALGFGRTKR